jgi:soluble lytic murein transglycosylase-like protein
MYVTRRWTVMVGVILFATTMHARENAVLRSGFTISHDHRQQLGAVTRLFLSSTDSEYVDVQTERIATFEKEEAPIETQHAASSPLPPSFVGPSSPDLNRIVIEASRKNQLDSDFVHAVIRAESRGNTNAVSRKGAQGLMQLMPGTAAKLGVMNSFDADENVNAGTRYLRELLERYHYDPVRALAAYNAGTGRVQQYNGVPPYRETRAYIAAIIRDFNRRKTEQERQAKASRKAAQASPPNPPATQDRN